MPFIYMKVEDEPPQGLFRVKRHVGQLHNVETGVHYEFIEIVEKPIGHNGHYDHYPLLNMYGPLTDRGAYFSLGGQPAATMWLLLLDTVARVNHERPLEGYDHLRPQSGG